MAGILKLKLRRGRDELEFEGERSDLDAILEKYWLPATTVNDLPSEDGGEIANDHEANEDGPGKKSGKLKRRRPAGVTPVRPAVSESPDMDFAQLANSIKLRDDFQKIDKLALHSGTQWDKVATVMWALEIPLTSGDLSKILHELRSNVPQPRVSEMLSRRRRETLKKKVRRGNNTVDGYQLSGPVMTKVAEWLNGNGKLDEAEIPSISDVSESAQSSD